MRALSDNLRRFVDDTRRVVAESRAHRPEADLKAMMADAPPVVSLSAAIHKAGFGLIAEIKECSPSQGKMLPENVAAAPDAYRSSPVVRGISVLTNRTFFGAGMTLDRLNQVKVQTGKPVLRKDFVIDRYQIYEARAYGADAVLLMANILDREEMRALFGVATELGMEVLFETHCPEEIEAVPAGARLYGINCRNFDQSPARYRISRWIGQASRWLGGRRKDLSVDFSRFDYSRAIPPGALKIAESGVSPETCAQVRAGGFDAILVGTSLLLGPERLQDVLKRFEQEIGSPEVIIRGAPQ